MDAEVALDARMSDFEIELQLLLDAIYLKYHYDFRGYAQASLKRRVRTALDRFGCATVSLLQDRILRDATRVPGAAGSADGPGQRDVSRPAATS